MRKKRNKKEQKINAQSDYTLFSKKIDNPPILGRMLRLNSA